MQGMVTALSFVMPPREQQLVERLEIALEGIVGDTHFGYTRRADSDTGYPSGTIMGNERQVTLIAEEELAEIAAAFDIPTIEPAWVYANIAVRGIPHLTLLPIGTRLRFPNETVLVVMGETLPCTFSGGSVQSHYPDVEGIATRFPKVALHKRGCLTRVERAGSINVGEAILVEFPKQPPYPENP